MLHIWCIIGHTAPYIDHYEPQLNENPSCGCYFDFVYWDGHSVPSATSAYSPIDLDKAELDSVVGDGEEDDSNLRVAGAGFEPAKAEPPDLQSGPFDRSGTPPGRSEDSDQVWTENSGRPASTSKSAYFGPPRRTPVPADTASAGMNHRLPSATTTNRRSQREALHDPFQLWFPPRVQSMTSHR